MPPTDGSPMMPTESHFHLRELLSVTRNTEGQIAPLHLYIILFLSPSFPALFTLAFFFFCYPHCFFFFFFKFERSLKGNWWQSGTIQNKNNKTEHTMLYNHIVHNKEFTPATVLWARCAKAFAAVSGANWLHFVFVFCRKLIQYKQFIAHVLGISLCICICRRWESS